MDEMTQSFARDGDPDRLDTDEIRRFLEKRWKLIAAVALGCALLALAVCLLLKPTYTATSQVLLDPHRQHVFGDAVQPDSALDSAIVDSQTSIITSTRLLAKVITKEKLADDPEFAASAKPGLLSRLVALFRPAATRDAGQPALDGIDPKLAPVIVNLFNRIEVTRIAKSYVLSLSVSSRDPAKATRLANSLAAAFVEDRIDVHTRALGQAASFFEDRLGSLRDQVRQSERAVADFRKKHDLTTTTMDGKLTVSELQLQHLNEQLALASTDTAEKLARYQQATRFAAAGANVDTLPEIIRSPVITQLRAQQADLLRRESDLSAMYGPAYPAVTEIRAQKGALERAIAGEMHRLVSTLHNDFDVASAREAALRKTIAGLSNVSGGGNDVGVQLRELERTNMANQALFENFLNRAKLTQEQSSFEEPDARLISPALEPTAPSFPKIKLIVPIATVVGVILGLGLAALADLFGWRPSGRTVAAAPPPHVLARVSRPRGLAGVDDIADYLAGEPASPFANAIEALAAKLVGPDLGEDGRVIALTSLDDGDGATDLAVALATVLDGEGARVLLVDAENRDLSAACGLADAIGLADVVAGTVPAAEAVLAWPHFALLPAGTAGAFADGDHAGAGIRSFLDEACRRFDLVLVVGPALAQGPAALTLGEIGDGLVLVANGDGPLHAEAVDTVEAAARTPGFLGIVLTQIETAQQLRALAS